MIHKSNTTGHCQSREWLNRAKERIPGGAQTFSKGPSSFMQSVAPNFLRRAQGAYAWDVDGNRYVDFILGLGPVILGHADPIVNEAARRQMQDGISFSLPHPIEVEVAEKLCEIIPCAEMVRFGKNGSDATSCAVRLARAYTGREKVACCGYHGWQDWYIGSTDRYLGVPGPVRALTVRFPYNNLEALRQLFRDHHDEVACVIMEPVTFDLPQPGYLQGVQELCKRNGSLLVFDEIVTGFRIHMGGAQEYFGVTPDLACFGKAIANGFPLSAIVGRAEVMRLLDKVFFSFTFGGEAMSLAACLATISELQQRDGVRLLWRSGEKLQKETRQRLVENRLTEKVECVGLPPWSTLRFHGTTEQESLILRSYFQQEAIRRGILTHGSHLLSLAHDENVIEETLAAYVEIFRLIAEAVHSDRLPYLLEGPPLYPVIRSF
ncbi:MAG: aminotransferase class III-fold pyridoxal phosphate-dependent enzyme [Acidobacteriota bacterium]